MAKKQEKSYQLSAYFSENSFVLDEMTCEPVDKDRGKQDVCYWYELFQRERYRALFHLGFLSSQAWFTPAIAYLYWIADTLIRTLSKDPSLELARHDIVVELTPTEMTGLLENIPFVVGIEYVDRRWIENIWFSLLDIFRVDIQQFDGSVARYFAQHNDQIHVADRIFFHLVENKHGDEPFAFMATYSNKPPKSKKTLHTPLKNALTEYKNDQQKLLSLIGTVVKVAEQSKLISELLESGELFAPIKFTSQEAYLFLREIELYESFGIMCRIPDWWRKRNNNIKISVSVGEEVPAKVGLEALLDFNPQLSVEGEPLTVQALREFMNMAEGIIQYKGKWIEINKRRLEAVLQAFDRIEANKQTLNISLAEAMRLELNIYEMLSIKNEDVELSVTNGVWLKKIKDILLKPTELEDINIVPSFLATLRPYQLDGYKWLHQISHYGFGACLADDMGLGKTIQIIAFLEYLRVHQGGQALLILPASLIGNWEKELQRFAPQLTYQVLHRSAIKNSEVLTIDNSAFLCMTTYGMAVRLEVLKEKKWDVLILDEAQAIKNPNTKQTKNIKKIPANVRIALTGTPIENKLSDLWSIFDFLNKGLLGSAKEFNDFSKKLNANASGYGRLRKIINPFLLRRIKTDKNVIADLPDKIEINEYASLSQKQVALYSKLVNQLAQSLDESEGIQRKGLILSSIVKCKQICNHPDQYLGLETYKPLQSGKFEQLKTLCETIYEKRERVLIFTQFKEIAEPLSYFLEGIFHKKGFVLHGGTSVKNRTKMVEAFNGENYIPYMVLSLKAGGVGLNLTGANHVVHFDRWWNPAVENQATDRAFRIGQTKNVMVHKFITKGTIEEKIDDMINQKQSLAENVLGGQKQQWITELDNEQLMSLFKLGGI